MSSIYVFFFSSRRRHTRCSRDWSSDVCSSDLVFVGLAEQVASLGMADQRDASSSLERERGGNRTGERAFRLPVDVLDAHQEVAALARRLGGGFDRDRGREEPHLAVLPAVVAGAEPLQISSGLFPAHRPFSII